MEHGTYLDAFIVLERRDDRVGNASDADLIILVHYGDGCQTSRLTIR